MPKLDRVLLRLHIAQAVPLLLVVAAVGCTATVTTTPPPPASSCSQASLACVQGTTGWSCTGSAQPEDYNPDLVCSTDGAGNFCCSTSTCTYDASITTCVTGAIGYSCAVGATPPDGSDPSLVCSVPATQNNVDLYCCYTNTITPPAGATCAQDPTVQGCQPNSYGFSCTGSDSPMADFSGLNCSTPTQGTGALLYCCTYL